MTDDEYLDELSQAALGGELLLFVGSGLSVGDGGLPTGRVLAEELAQAAGLDSSPRSLSEVAERVEATKGRGFLIGFLRDRIQRVSRPLAAHEVLSRLPIRTVVTTNYDLLLEQAYERSGLTYRRVCRPADVLGEVGGPSLFKIHGSIDLDESVAPIVITERDIYERFLEGRSIFLEMLRAWLLTKVCLFVGFGLRDANFLHLFFQISRMLREDSETLQGQFYAVQLEPDPVDVRIWRSRGIKVIDASAHQFLQDLEQAIELRAVRLNDDAGTLEFLPGAPVERVPRKHLDQMASQHSHYHRFVLISRLKREFILAARKQEHEWALLEYLYEGVWRTERVVVASDDTATPGIRIPRQLRTALSIPHGSLVLDSECLRLRRWDPEPMSAWRIAPRSLIGRPLLEVNDRILTRAEDSKERISEAIHDARYVQIRPLEMEQLGLDVGDYVTLICQDRSLNRILTLPQTHDNLCAIYMPTALREALGLIAGMLKSPLTVIRDTD